MASLPSLEHPVIKDLLRTRGLTTNEAIAQFLDTPYEEGLHDPMLLHDMEAAIARLDMAIAAKEHIVIYSDYDCDGIPGAVVLNDFLTAIGYENFSTYIPHRHYEGFGFNAASVEKLEERGAALVVTVDCGTSDHEAVAVAARAGIDVIITDHHEPKETLPEAVAVVNPKVGESYPFRELCGAGVVFKLVQALLATGRYAVSPGREKWSLDMVGLATIADMVPLVDENRVLARYGLMVLQKSRRPGLCELLRRQRASQRHLTEDDIGFTIGPRLNAASRMDAPEHAFTLLTTTDEATAATAAAHLETLNNERKGAVAAMTREAHTHLGQEAPPAVIVLGNPTWRPALAGLVANTLASEYDRPTFIWGRDGAGVLKGSARSNGSVSIITLMEAIQGTFLEYGGHHFSGGFSITERSVHTLSDLLCTSMEELGERAAAIKSESVDATLKLSDLTRDFIDSIFSFAPFGAGNPKPLFEFVAVTPERVEAFGKGREHTKLTFTAPIGKLEAISFFVPPERYGLALAEPKPCTLRAHLERSYFMGRLQTRLRIVDIA